VVGCSQDARCELLQGDGIDFIIDWQPWEEPVAEADLSSEVALFVTLNQMEEKDLFRQILSTFKFIE